MNNLKNAELNEDKKNEAKKIVRPLKRKRVFFKICTEELNNQREKNSRSIFGKTSK